tara:strand:- start:586 stop:987 length:402 start_codon:yes stop_codon:yes gene_type:complete
METKISNEIIMKKILILFFTIFCFSAFAVEKKTNFSLEMLKNAKADGKTIVINSYNISCGTCAKQTKILDQAQKEFKEIIFFSYDQNKNADLAKKLNIEFWTTIVVYKGDNEVARIIGQTDKKIIYSAIKKGI